MKEWHNKDKYCSYNSWKGLSYVKWYESIIDWKNGKRKVPLPPIEVSLDLFHFCQNACSFCNASRYIAKGLKNKRISDKHLINLIKFLGDWKVKAICYGGGGESTLHTKLPDVLLLSKKLKIDNSIATNGINFYDKLIEVSAKTCRWIGISVDASTIKTYKAIKQTDHFTTVIENLKKLVKEVERQKTNCLITYKFLIFDKNQSEIYDACKIAKDLGVHEFHARPADFSHQGMKERQKQNPYNINSILEQFNKCHQLRDENFGVFTVVHKFDKDFLPIKNFKQCWASPICIQLCADGNIYLCPDMRHQEFYKLGRHYPNPENILKVWGNKKHYDLVFKKGKKRCKTRCTFAPYNIQMERLYINNDDPMARWFV